MTRPYFDSLPSADLQRGIGMVEVLVALLIISIGLLGYAGLQLRALSSTEDAHLRSQAIAIAQDLSERIAVNPQALDTYLDDTNWTPLTITGGKPGGWDDCLTSACSIEEMAESDILQIRWQAAQLLPAGQVLLSECAGSDALCATVSWLDASPEDCAPPADQCVRLEVVTWEP
jgi:type IV pilus assembly protein PilV